MSSWYPWALERYGLKWLHITFGERNSIERLFRTFKERTKRFFQYYQGIEGSSESWGRAFIVSLRPP